MSNSVPWTFSLDLLSTPIIEQEWWIDGLIPKESLNLVVGREGSLKTWLAMYWAYSVAEGLPWLDRESQAGSVLYLDAENPRPVFLARLHAVGGSNNLAIWRWQDENFPTCLNDPRLLKAAQHFKLILIDSLRRFMRDLDENSANDMSRLTGDLRQLTRWGATVIALHHAGKDPSKAYRGSTELGAGVDVVMTIKKIGQQNLELAVPKTRYHEEPEISLAITRTPDRPTFRELGGSTSSSSQSTALDLDKILAVIKDIQAQIGTKPNQSQVITEARNKDLGSRNTILARLRQGEGTLWNSETDGRSRVYEPVLSSNPRGEEQVDNTSTDQPQPVLTVESADLSSSSSQGEDTLDTSQPDLSTCPNGRGVDTLDRFQQTASSDDLSNCPTPMGLDRLDNRTRPAGTPEVGSTANYFDRQGIAQSGTVDLLIEWPGLPEVYAYQIDGQIVAPSRVG